MDIEDDLPSIDNMEPTTRERELQWRELLTQRAITGDKEARKRLLVEYGQTAGWDKEKGELVKFTEN